MDPFSALTIASCVVQFVDFGSKLVAQFVELYQSSEGLQGNLDLEEVTEDLSDLSESLTNVPPSNPGSKDEQALHKIAQSCNETSEELLSILRKLRVQGKHQTWQSLRKALRSMLRKEKIETLKKKLERLQTELNTRLLAIMSNQQSTVVTTLRTLADENKRLETDTISRLDNLKLELIRALKQSPSQINSTNTILVDVSARLSAFLQEGRKVTKEQTILNSLRFDLLTERHSQIKDPTPETLQWIYRYADFSEWLCHRSGIYWISGKAGSGKSTLMKFLSDTSRSRLQAWAGGEELLVCSYFFWNSGHSIQKSQNGLLQSLLYQILRRYPVLMKSIISEDMWNYDISTDFPSWTSRELSETLHRFATQTLLSTKYCFFVDGLDEYEGDLQELITLFDSLAASPNIKICLSSRPWTEFSGAYGQSPNRTLAVHEHSKEDIRRHTEVRLNGNPHYLQLRRKDPQYRKLVEEIVEKAQGVFLWVYLVVGSLLNGLQKEDTISDLQRRLQLLPTDLEKYFMHIFNSIEDVYRQQTAQIFLVTVRAAQPLSVMAFLFLNQESEDEHYALNADISRLTQLDLDSTQNQMKKSLNARCRDLLEVNPYPDEGIFFLKYKVDFLHRTVRDFLLEGKDMQETLKRGAGPNFDPYISLCRIFLAQIKALPFENGIEHGLNPLFALVDELMFYAGEAEYFGKHLQNDLLDEVNRTITQHACDISCHWTNARDPLGETYKEHDQKTFLASAIQARLRLYTKFELNRNPKALREKRGRPLLDYALRPAMVTPIQLPFQRSNIDSELVRMLLDKGSEPNEKISIFSGETVWKLFLMACYKEHKASQYDPRQNEIYEVVKMLLEAGADPDVKCQVDTQVKSNKNETKTRVTSRYKRTQPETQTEVPVILGVSELLAQSMPKHKHRQLIALLEDKRQSWQSSFWRRFGY